MSWTDLKSVEQFKKLRDFYNIKTFVETGTFRGVNAEVHSQNFDKVITCELMPEYYDIAIKRLSKYNNVFCILGNSIEFLNNVKKSTHKNDIIFIYLDAHFYDPSLSPDDRWVVLKELKSLADFGDCVIAIHDFDNGELGHLNYDGQNLNFDLLKENLYKVNPDFHYYTNTRYGCNIVTEELIRQNYLNVEIDENIKDTLNFVWSSDQKTYRGILYCTPTKLDLNNFELRKL